MDQLESDVEKVVKAVLQVLPAQKRHRVLIATGGKAGQGDFGVCHRAHIGFGPRHVENVWRSGGGRGGCATGGSRAGRCAGGLSGKKSSVCQLKDGCRSRHRGGGECAAGCGGLGKKKMI